MAIFAQFEEWSVHHGVRDGNHPWKQSPRMARSNRPFQAPFLEIALSKLLRTFVIFDTLVPNRKTLLIFAPQAAGQQEFCNQSSRAGG
jgi:hypothetical protein